MRPEFFFLFLLIALAVGFFLWRKDQQRQAALRLWARGRGWRLPAGGDRRWDVEYPGVKLFQRGHSRGSRCVITGRDHDRDVVLMDYRYVTGHGKNRSTHRHGVVLIAAGFPTIPLQIRRENPLDRVGEFFGADDIDFESTEFSRRFFVKSADRRWAYDVIHTRTMEYLLTAPDFQVEFGTGELVLHSGRWLDAAAYERALEMGRRLLDLIPDYVIRQMKGEPS